MQMHLQTKIAIGVGLVLAIVAIIWANSGPSDREKIPVNNGKETKQKDDAKNAVSRGSGTPTARRNTTTPDRRRSSNRRTTPQPTRTSAPPATAAPQTTPQRNATPSSTAGNNRSSRLPSPIGDTSSQTGRSTSTSPPSTGANAPATTGSERTSTPPALPNPIDPKTTTDDARLASMGSTPTTTPPATPARPAAVREHTIESGDTFSSLAVKYYGSERYTSKLVAANKQIKDPDRLKIGQKVFVPTLESLTGGTAGRTAAATPSRTAASPASNSRTASAGDASTLGSKQYRVQQGDTFASIARTKLGDERRWPYLYEINRDQLDGGPDSIRPGMVIILEEQSN